MIKRQASPTCQISRPPSRVKNSFRRGKRLIVAEIAASCDGTGAMSKASPERWSLRRPRSADEKARKTPSNPAAIASQVRASGCASTQAWAALLTGLSAYVCAIHWRFFTTLPAIADAWRARSRRPLVNRTQGCCALIR